MATMPIGQMHTNTHATETIRLCSGKPSQRTVRSPPRYDRSSRVPSSYAKGMQYHDWNTLALTEGAVRHEYTRA